MVMDRADKFLNITNSPVLYDEFCDAMVLRQCRISAIMTSTRAQGILDFWFGAPDQPGYGRRREVWFKRDDGFDAEIRNNFMSDYGAAKTGVYDTWSSESQSCLALIILLDQFPRNMFRDSPDAYATDEKARTVARIAVAKKFDAVVLPIQRVFFYLPFEHSENLEDQDLSVALFNALPDDDGKSQTVSYADRHRDAIVRFGRFPHRNAVLGRASTPEELQYLKDNGSF